MRVKSESDIAQSCPTLSDPMGCSPPGSSVHGIFPARVLEWGAIEIEFKYQNIVSVPEILKSPYRLMSFCPLGAGGEGGDGE